MGLNLMGLSPIVLALLVSAPIYFSPISCSPHNCTFTPIVSIFIFTYLISYPNTPIDAITSRTCFNKSIKSDAE